MPLPPWQPEGAQALSGGQTLVPTMKQRLAAPEFWSA
jgi:CO/xanthine dehydrogenase FAD-binding subunit